jgi:circadian clock protein KaiB
VPKKAARTDSRRRPRLVPAKPRSSTKALEKLAGKRRSDTKYELRLYIAGMTPRSSRAIANVRRICEEHMAGRYDLEIVDLYQNPVLSKGEQIVAVPTLIKKLPTPLRKFIGDMSDTARILVGLDLRPKSDSR